MTYDRLAVQSALLRIAVRAARGDYFLTLRMVRDAAEREGFPRIATYAESNLYRVTGSVR